VQDIVTAPEGTSLSKKCPACTSVLEVTVDSCWKCGAKVGQEIHMAPYKEKQSFKPYLGTNTDVGKAIYERFIQAFAKVDPRERPWCGIGVKADLLAVSPRGVTAAVIKELGGIKQGRVHVSQNWRQPWQVETVDGEKHHIQGNPCEQAERAINAIKNSLEPFLKANGQPLFPHIKCLIIFPDGFEFQGPKDFSIIDRGEVVTLKLRNFRDLPEAILQPAQQENLDSRKYRKWIESDVLRSNNDSIFGTWLDPTFDKVKTEPPKGQLWWLRRARHQEVSAEEEEFSSSDSSRRRPIQTKFKWPKLKPTVTVITSTIIGTIGWRLYNVNSAATPPGRGTNDAES
jgi:hypothetical protein